MSQSENKVDLKNLFDGLQSQMLSRLTTISENVEHPTTQGDGTELNWIEMLKNYLPKRYKVDKAFVLDHEGNLSDQIDIVIYDQHYSPFLFNESGILYVPAESVYAVIEVKPILNKENLEYAGKKAASVRKLTRTSGIIIDKGGMRRPRELFPILGGVVSSSIEWEPPFGDSFTKIITNFSNEEKIELGCGLDSGAFRVYYDSKPKIEISGKETALIFFFISLVSKLQLLGTASAIEFDAYEQAIK